MRSHPRRGSSDEELYTIGEEIANSVTHGVGTLLSLAGLISLVVLGVVRGGAGRIAAFSVYGTTLVLLHIASTLYHALRPPRAKRVFRILDHAAIYLVIAGTYTPFCVLAVDKPTGWIVLGVIWAVASAGITLKSLLIGRFGIASTAGYAVIGWAGVFLIWKLYGAFPLATIGWLLGGGVCYSLGIVFYAWRRLRYSHMVWHLFVLGGAACHYVAVMLYL